MAMGELPYWETVNKYLERLDPQELQDVIHELVRRLLSSRAFGDAGIRGRYWQVIVDGTQVHSSRKELDERSLYRIHNRGTEGNRLEQKLGDGVRWHDFVTGIDYSGYGINIVEYGEEWAVKTKRTRTRGKQRM